MLKNGYSFVDRFRWVFCQLETLRQCLPASVRVILAELPETLDGTYERMLSEIPKSNRVYTHRLLQCLTVAVRPLSVEELAEVLAVDFTPIGGIPQLKGDLRWEDEEQAVLTACSSLIVVVEDGYLGRVVQFAHFSVKEFLTSDRLATLKMDASRYYHIRLEEAHTIMAQACLSVLLRLDYDLDKESVKSFPLAEYAAGHFGDHVEFEGVLSQICYGVDDLLDAEKPRFAAWLWMRTNPHLAFHNTYPQQPDAVPLYYLVEFGYFGLVHYLISKRPEDINAVGEYGTLLHAASHVGHREIVDFLLDHFVDVDVRNCYDQTPLHLAVSYPYSWARENIEVDSRFFEVIRILLIEHNADINARDHMGKTPLHQLIFFGHGDAGFELAKFLLDHGADADTRDNEASTLLHVASARGSVKVVQLLLKHDTNINIHMKDKRGRTPLHQATTNNRAGVLDFYYDAIPFLLEHGADVDALDDDHSTPLHLAAQYSGVKAARPLLKHGANIHARNKNGRTPLHESLANFHNKGYRHSLDIISLLLENGADVDARDNDHSTPLHLGAQYGAIKEVVCPLLEHGANVHAGNKNGRTPLHESMNVTNKRLSVISIHSPSFDVIPLLLEHGADVNARDNDQSTPLHLAAQYGSVKAARPLLKHGVDIHARNKDGRTPLHESLVDVKKKAYSSSFDVICLLLKHGADVDSPDSDHSTPLHVAAKLGRVNVARVLLEHGASVHLQNNEGKTPLEVASARGRKKFKRLLSKHLVSEQNV